MRSTAKRTIAVAALGFPLLLGAPAVALAGDEGSKPDHGKPLQNLEQAQGQQNGTEQSNSNASPVYQINVGGEGDQSAGTWTGQSNDNATGQVQGQEGEHGKGKG